MSEKYFGIRPGPGRKHPDDEIKICPKCGSEMEELYTKNWIIGGVHEGWSCPKCGHEEKVKT